MERSIEMEMPGGEEAARVRSPRTGGTAMSDVTAELVARAVAGDPASLGKVVGALKPWIHASVAGALRGGASRDEVEDRLQDVFVLLLEDGGRRLRAWDPARGPKYIKKISRNVVFSAQRSRTRSSLSSDSLSLDDLEREPASDGVDPEIRALRAQFQGAVVAGLEADLSEHELEVFLLLVEGLSAREVCQKTGIKTENAVHMVRRRIVLKAREIAEALLGGRAD